MSRTAYFFLRGNPIQFKITAIITVCWDLGMSPHIPALLTISGSKSAIHVRHGSTKGYTSRRGS
jgi:hypothetical protein